MEEAQDHHGRQTKDLDWDRLAERRLERAVIDWTQRAGKGGGEWDVEKETDTGQTESDGSEYQNAGTEALTKTKAKQRKGPCGPLGKSIGSKSVTD